MEFLIKIDCTDRLENAILHLSESVRAWTSSSAPVKQETPKAETKKPKAETPKVEEPKASPAEEVEQARGISDSELADAFKACRNRLMNENKSLLTSNNGAVELRQKIKTKVQEYIKGCGCSEARQLPQDKREDYLKFLAELKLEEEETDDLPF